MLHPAGECNAGVYSNTAQDRAHRLADAERIESHSFIDFGDDPFTRRRPHSMIEPSLRIARLREEARRTASSTKADAPRGGI